MCVCVCVCGPDRCSYEVQTHMPQEVLFQLQLKEDEEVAINTNIHREKRNSKQHVQSNKSRNRGGKSPGEFAEG